MEHHVTLAQALRSGEWDEFRLVTVALLVALFVFVGIIVMISNKHFSRLLRRHLTRVEAHEESDERKFTSLSLDIAEIKNVIRELKQAIIGTDPGTL